MNKGVYIWIKKGYSDYRGDYDTWIFPYKQSCYERGHELLNFEIFHQTEAKNLRIWNIKNIQNSYEFGTTI